MILEADKGILFRPPDNVMEEYPNVPVTENYEELKAALEKTLNGV